MSSAHDNPLLYAPFFPIPGIDPNDPISAQTEKLDQMNTLLLREIDANLARFHQNLTSKVLPQVKKYALGSEPTRDASKFWRAFFETASSVRLSDQGETTMTSEHPGASESMQYDDQTLILRRDADESSIRNDGSFMFDPPTSSTPLPSGRALSGDKPSDSWEDSMESPFDRLDRKLRDDLRIDETGKYVDHSSSEMATPSLPSGYSMPGMDTQDSSNISSFHNLNDYSVGTVDPSQVDSSTSFSSPRSDTHLAQSYRASPTPRAHRLAKPPPAGANPFGPAFSGIADLRSTPLNMKTKGKGKAAKPKTSIVPGLEDESDSDSGDDGFPPGMSPPRTMTFSLPPRAQAIMNVARTPGKGTNKDAQRGTQVAEKEKEAKFILDDLLEEMSQEMSPKMETPEALRRYSVLPHEAGAGRLLFSASSARPVLEEEDEDVTYHAPPQDSLSHHSLSQHSLSQHSLSQHSFSQPQPHSRAPRDSLANSSFNSNTTERHVPSSQIVFSNEESFDEDDEDDDSFDTSAGGISSLHVPSTGGSITHPGFALSYPAQLAHGQYLHQQPEENAGDESYLSSEGDATNTSLFGGHGGRDAGAGFALMTKDEMETYHGGRLEDAAGKEVEFSPTNMIGRAMGR